MTNVLKWVLVLVSAFGSGVAATHQADPKAPLSTQSIGGGLAVLGSLPALLKKSPATPDPPADDSKQ